MLEMRVLFIELFIRKKKKRTDILLPSNSRYTSLIPNAKAEAKGANSIAYVFDRVTNHAAPLGGGARTALLKHLRGVEWNTWSAPCLAFPAAPWQGLGSLSTALGSSHSPPPSESSVFSVFHEAELFSQSFQIKR